MNGMTFAPIRRKILRASIAATALAITPIALSCSKLGAQRPGSLSIPSATLTGLDVSDLPLIEVPARGRDVATLAIFLTGDGGWADLDRKIAGVLADNGLGVVGLDSRAYLKQRRSPDQAATDVARIARAYTARWGARRLVLIGYSRGATMLPFVATRLDADLRQRTALLAMLGLERTTNLQFHWIDVVKDVSRADDLPVAPELERLRGQRMVCVFGSDEKDRTCRDADPALITRVERKGDHHLGGDYKGLARLILGLVLPP